MKITIQYQLKKQHLRFYIILNIIIVCFVFPKNIAAQSFEQFFAKNENINDTSKIYLSFENTNFFKNNEYSSNFAKGYTLIGYFLKPKICFRLHKKLKISAGLHLQKYSGIDKFTEIQPSFSVVFAPSSKFTLIFGELEGTVNHNLPETMFDNEKYLTENIENGLQLLFNTNRLKSDLWLNWTQYIFENSDYPESFILGSSNIFTLFNLSEKHILNLKFAATATHVGGQIDSSGVPVETIFNTNSGLEYQFRVNKMNMFKFYGFFNTAIDDSPKKYLPYIYGYGLLSGIEYNYKNIDLKVEHWFAERFFANYGNPLYQSVSARNPDNNEDKRTLIIAHLFWQKKYFKFMQLGLGADFFYDLYNYSLNYSCGFYIKINITKHLSN